MIKAEAENHTDLSYEEWATFCRNAGVAHSDEEVASTLRSFSDAGVVLHFQNRVYLQPKEIAETILSVCVCVWVGGCVDELVWVCGACVVVLCTQYQSVSKPFKYNTNNTCVHQYQHTTTAHHHNTPPQHTTTTTTYTKALRADFPAAGDSSVHRLAQQLQELEEKKDVVVTQAQRCVLY